MGGVHSPLQMLTPLKLRLDVVLGDSSASLSVSANMFSWHWFENL